VRDAGCATSADVVEHGGRRDLRACAAVIIVINPPGADEHYR
jgi:hypothetical protein